MGLFNKKVIHEFNKKGLGEYLVKLQKTEEEIHHLSKWKDVNAVLSKAKERHDLITELLQLINKSEDEIEQAIKVVNVENKEHLDKIKNYLVEIEKILKKQLNELKKEETLADDYARTLAIDGLNKSGDSNLTIQIKHLSQYLNSQSGVVIRYIAETEREAKQLKEDNQAEKIKQRFIISEDGQTIYDNKTKLTWERDMSKREKMTWNDAMKINDNGFRLPSLEDWKTLAISKEFPLIHELQIIGFKNIKEYWYWTSNKYESTYAYVVRFCDGRSVDYDVTSSYYVLCVKTA